MGLLKTPVGLEPCGESGVLCGSLLNDPIYCLCSIFIPGDILHSREIDIETIDSWGNEMHLIGHIVPEGLMLSNIVGIQVLLDLIQTCAKLHSSAVMALVDVLVNVLDSLDGCNPLKIDITTIFPDEVRTVRHYLAIVNLLSIDLECSSCIAMTKDSIKVLRKSCLILERLWRVLGALLCLLIHAGGCWIVNTTGTIDYELLVVVRFGPSTFKFGGTGFTRKCKCHEKQLKNLYPVICKFFVHLFVTLTLSVTSNLKVEGPHHF